MKQAIGYVAIFVRDYDEAIKFYVDTLGFHLVEDTFVEAQRKRWVLLAPPGPKETRLLLRRVTSNTREASRAVRKDSASPWNGAPLSAGRQLGRGLSRAIHQAILRVH
jgi:catechol 2,3-dioxygenase-like lactoylglutathione lyase family enzyme